MTSMNTIDTVITKFYALPSQSYFINAIYVHSIENMLSN